MTVNINPNNNLTTEQKNAIKQGFINWQNSNDSSGNNSGVTFVFTESATNVSGQLDKVQVNIQQPASARLRKQVSTMDRHMGQTLITL